MALVLKRRTGDSLIFTTRDGQRIVLDVTAVDEYGEVRIVIEAPRDVEILRGELERRSPTRGRALPVRHAAGQDA